MYLPRHFEMADRAELLRLVERHPLATIVAVVDGEAAIEHVPLLAESAGDALRFVGHFARANPFPGRVQAGARVTAVFRGADAYVTPTAYATKQRDPRVVPTWNYSVMHATGRIRWFDDVVALHALVSRLTAHHEAAHGSHWRVEDAPADYLARQFRAIVGFELEVDAIEGKAKASQNRTAEDREGVRTRLQAEGFDTVSVAELVREPRPR